MQSAEISFSAAVKVIWVHCCRRVSSADFVLAGTYQIPDSVDCALTEVSFVCFVLLCVRLFCNGFSVSVFRYCV